MGSDEMMPFNEDDDIDSDLGASREDYEAHLGKFLVAFNRIEDTVSDLVGRALSRAGRDDLIDRAMTRGLDRKLDDLELLLIQAPPSQRLPFAEIRQLSLNRNDLAHGHYDDWQGFGSFEVITRSGKRKTYSPEVIAPLIARAEDLAFKLRQQQARWDFDQISDALDEPRAT